GQGSEIKCQACDEENQALSRCTDCDQFLCQECQKAHGRMTVMKSHKIYTLAELRSGEIVYKSKLRDEVPKCGKHPDQNLNVYCDTCEQVICLMCTVLDHGNPKHSLIGLSEAFGKCKNKVEELVSEVTKSKTELNTTIEKTCTSRKKLDIMFENTKKKISEKADQEVAKIRQEEQTLLTETDRIYQERVTTFEAAQANNSKAMTQTKHKLEEVKQLMNQASCYEILELQQKLLHNLSELTGKQPQQVPDKLTFMDFEEGERSLGRLILKEEPKAAAKQSLRPARSCVMEKRELKTEEQSRGAAKQSPRLARSCVKEKWELKTEFKNFEVGNTQIRHVSALSDNNIVLTNWNNTLFTVSLTNSQHTPSPITQRLQINGLTDARCIAVSKDDKLLALDGAVVKVFNKQHQLLHQFTPGIGSGNHPTCLAVDDSNLIAVGYEVKNEISLHNPDGSLIRRLPAPMIGGYLTMYNHRLIYTNYGSRRLVCVDYYGASVFPVDMTSNMQGRGCYPTGVCCGSDGSIYVAVYGYLTGNILHYSPDGKYIGCVIKGCGYPRGISFTSGGDLVVAEDQSVKVYHRV
ncbi:E3 ubiquitin-protein ligase TRIM71-like, partial [Patiria miniata]|uniref:B box-type domain-containing protein n=1 Tax=Patiria miniata TaxID=46514 RepID=A0A913ZPQ0_PATMI